MVSSDFNANTGTTNNDGHLRLVVRKCGVCVRNERDF